MNTKKVIFLTAVVVILGSIIVPAFADWTAPLDGPVTCNTSDPGCDAPINVSNKDQVKQTGSTPGYTGGLSIGPLMVNGSGIITSKLGIGNIFNVPTPPTPSAPLDVDGDVNIRGVSLPAHLSCGKWHYKNYWARWGMYCYKHLPRLRKSFNLRR